MLIDIDKNKAKEYCDKILSLMEVTCLTEGQRFSFYNNLGTKYLSLEDYHSSIKYLIKALELSEVSALRCYLCICFSYFMLNETIPNIYLSYTDKTKGDHIDWLFYQFFVNLYKNKTKENKTYIMKKVFPLLRKDDTLYRRMIQRIIMRFCEEKQGYKALYEFMK